MPRSQLLTPKTDDWRSLPPLPSYPTDIPLRRRFPLWWWPWFSTGILVVFFVALSFLAGRFTAPPLPSHPPTPGSSRIVIHTPTTVQTFTGSKSAQTKSFVAPTPWQISWLCIPGADAKGQYQVFKIDVIDADTNFFEFTASDQLCQPGHVSGSIEESQAGHFYLYITSKGPWALEIQTLQ